eukprot:GFKZ01013797.1.p1 GENE.GFKZ01013797.1~~GFKZ01013797.1.p1  ORF type:complete len:164 (-),score=10.18 GFKZ01013797.1:305-796(-)
MPTSAPPEAHHSEIEVADTSIPIPPPCPPPIPGASSIRSLASVHSSQHRFSHSNSIPRRTSASQPPSRQNSLQFRTSEQVPEEDVFVMLFQAFEAFVIGTFAGVLVNLFALCCVKERIWRGIRGFGRDLCEVGGAWPFVFGVIFGGVLQVCIAAFIVVSLIRD